MRHLADLNGREYDVAIIGGGIHGCSAARHLSEAGYRVLLVEQGDYGAGTTSRSTRNLNCGLVFFNPAHSFWHHALHPAAFVGGLKAAKLYQAARTELLRAMPGRLTAYRAHLPVYGSDPRAPWMVGALLKVVERLGAADTPLSVERLSQTDCANHPLLRWLARPADLRCVYVITEYVYDWPERIAVDEALSAARLGAETRNYTRLAGLERSATAGWRLTLNGVHDDAEAQVEAPVQVEARALINTAGPWVDAINRLSEANAPACVEGIKGAHVVVKLPADCQGQALYGFVPGKGGRYLIPWRDLHHFGTTQTPTSGDPSKVVAEESEIEGLMADLTALLPGANLGRDDVLSAWAGVRPATLARRGGGLAHADFPTIWDLNDDGLPNAFAVTGASISSHRETGRDLTARVRGILQPSSEPKTSQAPLSGATEKAATPLANRADSPSVEQLREIAAREQVVSLADLLTRRLGATYSESLGLELAQPAANAIAETLGWDEGRVAREVRDYEVTVRRIFNRETD